MEKGRIAVPSMEAGGLDGKRSGHFGHCDVFTLIDVKDGAIEKVSILSYTLVSCICQEAKSMCCYMTEKVTKKLLPQCGTSLSFKSFTLTKKSGVCKKITLTLGGSS